MSLDISSSEGVINYKHMINQKLYNETKLNIDASFKEVCLEIRGFFFYFALTY